jgi:hypothetical protein
MKKRPENQRDGLKPQKPATLYQSSYGSIAPAQLDDDWKEIKRSN